jgi:uncharacterized MAPEG superfamily protein
MSIELMAIFGIGLLLWVLTLVQSVILIKTYGIPSAVGNRGDLPVSPEGIVGRAQRVVRNHVEGVAIFAPIALSAVILDISNDLTQYGALLYLVGRVLHAIIYLLGIVWLRSIVFVAMIDVGLVMTIVGVVRGLSTS